MIDASPPTDTFEILPGSDPAFGALVDRAASERAIWLEYLRRSGALLIRDYQIETIEQFAELVAVLAAEQGLREYRGGASPRKVMLGGSRPIYNSTEYPPHVELPLHNELSYSADYPALIYFFCLVEPAEGGATTLADSRSILRTMPREVRSLFERKGVRYIRNLPPGSGSGYSWADAFGCDDPREVEMRCAASGAEAQWLPGGYLRIVQDRPATAEHPVTGEEVWFNQAVGFHPSCLDDQTYRELIELCGSEDRFRLNVQFGDGEPIAPEMLRDVSDVLQQETRSHCWRKGDVLVLDNLLTAHGRRTFRGARRIATAMS